MEKIATRLSCNERDVLERAKQYSRQLEALQARQGNPISPHAHLCWDVACLDLACQSLGRGFDRTAALCLTSLPERK